MKCFASAALALVQGDPDGYFNDYEVEDVMADVRGDQTDREWQCTDILNSCYFTNVKELTDRSQYFHYEETLPITLFGDLDIIHSVWPSLFYIGKRIVVYQDDTVQTIPSSLTEVKSKLLEYFPALAPSFIDCEQS